MILRTPIGAGLLALCLAACGHNASSDGIAQLHQQVAVVAHSFLDKLPTAHRDVAYSGTRTVWLSYEIAGRPNDLVYEERVFSDGQGRFALIPGDVREPRMNQTEKQMFALDQERREAFLFLHRDFRVRDLGLFLENYAIADTGAEPVIAARSCVELAVRRRADSHDAYRVAVDPQTGLVMRYEELASNGRTVARVEFVTFSLAPDFQGVELSTSAFAGTPLDTQHAAQEIGFGVSRPAWVPSGYQLVRADQVDDGTRKWARLVYGDGVDQVFYLFSAHETARPAARAPQVAQATLNDHGVVKVFQAGPLCVAEYAKDSERAIAIGKVGEENLLELLQSTLD